MIVFRQADPRYPFLWSGSSQPPARWHGEGEGPAHYFADTPDGAWAELLRHEEITDPADVQTIRRALWAVDIGEERSRRVRLAARLATGGRDSYTACQAHARRLRARGVQRLDAPSAALLPGGATGRIVSGAEERDAAPREGRVIVVFGDSSPLVGWQAVAAGAPPPSLLTRVRHFQE
jgi:hypothetical protein